MSPVDPLHPAASEPARHPVLKRLNGDPVSLELGVNPKTVAKWCKRTTVEDRKTGPSEPRSTVLTGAEEAMAFAIRGHRLVPLGNCLYALQSSTLHPTRSASHSRDHVRTQLAGFLAPTTFHAG